MFKSSNIIIKEEQEEREVQEEQEEQINNKLVYILDYKFIKKHYEDFSKIYKGERCDYLPIVNNENIELEDIVNSKFLIYLKSSTVTKSTIAGYYGYFISEKIIINNKQAENLKNKHNKNIEVDENEYRKMIKNYGLCVMEKLIFIKYKKIIKFDHIVSPTKYKTICKENKIENKKIPTTIKFINITKFEIDDIIKYIEMELEKEAQIQEQQEEEQEEDEHYKNEEKEDLSQMVIMDIPIAWVPCNTILDKIEETSIKKSDIIYHYEKCEKCDITDNNRIKFNFLDKKINLQIKEGEEHIEKMNYIIEHYQNCKKYVEKNSVFSEMSLYEDKINLIYYNCEDEFYDKTFFVITK
jgi:hypothetical protein